jgi:hypothetical protein
MKHARLAERIAALIPTKPPVTCRPEGSMSSCTVHVFSTTNTLKVFVESTDTVEGSAQHKRVDKEGQSAPAPEEVFDEPVIVRSMMLSSDTHQVIAKLDLAEFSESRATPADYKHGRPMTGDEGPSAWPRIGCNLLFRRWCSERTDTGAKKE